MKKMFSKKTLCLLLAALLCLSMFSACGSKNDTAADNASDTASDAENTTAAETEGKTEETTASSGKDTLVVVLDQEIVSADPADQAQRATSQFMIQIYETLLYFDENNTPQPLLAESVTQKDDVTYEVKLRQGVKFHNGEEMKASDAVFSLSRAIENPKTASNIGDFDPDGFEIIDDYTFTMKTLEPVATFYASLCSTCTAIVSEKAVTELGDNFSKDATGAGTGPYKFVEWIPAQEVSIERFDDYWREPAKIKNMTWKFVSDANSRSVMLETGEADVIYQVQTAGIEALLANDELTVYSVPSTTIRFIYFNQSEGLPMSNEYLRKAVSYAIDREALVKNVFGEYATPATSFLAPAILGHTDDVETYDYNPEKAKEMLAEAGYEPGELTLTMSMHAQNVLTRMAEVIQAYLADVGINMEIQALDTAAWVAALAEGQTQMGFNANSNTSCDPDVLFTPCHSSLIPAPNHGCVNDPELDALLEKGARTFDNTEREKIYVEAQQLIADKCYLYPICYDNNTMAVRNELKGFTPTSTAQDRFYVCYFE